MRSCWPNWPAPTVTTIGLSPVTATWPKRSRSWPEPIRVMIWTRQRQLNQLRSALREFYPGRPDRLRRRCGSNDALAVLAIAPTPILGAELVTLEDRRRRCDEGAADGASTNGPTEIQTAATHRPARPPRHSSAKPWARRSSPSPRSPTELTAQIDRLEADLAASFDQHPDAEIIRSLAGLGMILGARALAEFGDDPNRYAERQARKNYAGTSPITRASGKSHVGSPATPAINASPTPATSGPSPPSPHSPGAKAFYDQPRTAGDTHSRALRARPTGSSGSSMAASRHHTPDDEHTAWGHRSRLAA